MFHQPTGLAPSDRVWLVIENLDSPAKITLNSHNLTARSSPPLSVSPSLPPASLRYDITPHITASNEIVIEIAAPSQRQPRSGEPPADVRLEIDSDGNQPLPA